MNKFIVETRDLSRTYEDVKVTALKNINLRIFSNEFVAIIGPSGSGKTTLLNLIGTLDNPSTGEIYFEGRALSKVKNKPLFRLKNIGFVFQNYYLFPTLNAIENVMMPFPRSFWTRRNEIDKAKSLLEMLGLKERMYHNVRRLSGGESQRVVIARALARNPKLILADEPTGNLDSENGKIVLEILKGLKEEKKITILMVTHDPIIGNYATRTIRIFDGKILD